MLSIFKTSWPGLLNEFINNESFPYVHDVKLFQKPSANIVEDENKFIIDVAIPGIDKEDLKINLEDQLLTISSEKEEKKEESGKNVIRKEFSYQSFKRTFCLPDMVDQDQIAADFKDGILRLSIPKKEEAKVKPNRLIEVQ